MGTKQNKLDELKGQNPFKLPAGYFEGLTEQIMSRLPETPREEAPAISLLDRVRPWLYMAAVFIGLVLLFKGITSGQQSDTPEPDTESMFRSVLLGGNMFTASEEDLEYLEYLEYLESEYLSGAFTEELENAE
ncbi:MAG: hypothetical protein LBH90_03920 [Tannerella sp.]|jgi:hypothetical protein|nr:hypothetical protein [Tannerella sp.]